MIHEPITSCTHLLRGKKLLLFLCLVYQWQFATAQNPVYFDRTVSLAWFVGSLHHNHLRSAQSLSNDHNRPNNIKSFGFWATYNGKVSSRFYLSYSLSIQKFRTENNRGKLIEERFDHGPAGLYSQYYKYESWSHSTSCTRMTSCIQFNQILGKPHRRVTQHLSMGFGIEKSLKVAIESNEYGHYWSSSGKKMHYNSQSGEYTLHSYNNKGEDLSKRTTASEHFGIKLKPTTIIIQPNMNIRIRVFSWLGLNLNGGCRFYINPYLGVIESYFLSKMYYFSSGLEYSFHKKPTSNKTVAQPK